MKKAMNQFDIFTPRATLYYEGNSRYHSKVGLFLSIIFFLLTVGFGIYFLISFLKGDEMSVIPFKDTKPQQILANLSNKIFFYALKDELGKELDPRVIQSYPVLWEESPDGAVHEALSEAPCSSDSFIEEKKKLINLNVSGFRCPLKKNGTESIVLTSDKSLNSSSYLTIYVAKCQNKTENNNHCLEDEEINSIIKKSKYYFYFYTEELTIDSNSKTPLIPSAYSEKIRIPKEIDDVEIHDYRMRKVQYESNQGVFNSLKKTFEDFGLVPELRRVEAEVEEEDFLIKDPFLVYQLKIDDTVVEKYRRTYQKFQTFAANLGGMCSLLHFIAEFITYLFCQGEIVLSIKSSLKQKEDKINTTKVNDSHKSFTIKNGFLSTQPTLMTMLKSNRKLAQKKRETKVVEKIFFRCLRNRKNFKVLKECEGFLLDCLDVTQIIEISKEVKNLKHEKGATVHNSELNLGGILMNQKNISNIISQEISAEQNKSSVPPNLIY